MTVVVYSTPTCGYCHQVKKYLSDKGVAFVEHDISSDRAAAEEMMRLTGQMGVPVIVVNGKPVIGFDRGRLDKLLAGGGGNGHRPRFGLKIADASKIAQKAGSIPVFGALVGGVTPGTPADKAGIKSGDIITEINLRPVKGADDFQKALAGLMPGGRATIVLLRGDQKLKKEFII